MKAFIFKYPLSVKGKDDEFSLEEIKYINIFNFGNHCLIHSCSIFVARQLGSWSGLER